MEKFTQAPVGLDIDQTVSSNSTAIAKWASRHSASDIGTITSLSALQSTLKTLADALALYETKYFFVTISFSGTFEYYNTVYTGEITYITPDRYNVLMQNHTNASQIYRGACASGTWSWSGLVTKSDLSTLKSKEITIPQVSAGGYQTIDETVTSANFGIIAGFIINGTLSLVLTRLYMPNKTTISVRVRNVDNSAVSNATITVYYI